MMSRAVLRRLLCEPEGLLLRLPLERQVDAADQLLGCEVLRLSTPHDGFDDLRCQEGQRRQTADIPVIDAFALGDGDLVANALAGDLAPYLARNRAARLRLWRVNSRRARLFAICRR